MSSRLPRRLARTWGWGAWLAIATVAAALELKPARTAETDLEITGGLAGVPAGETRYMSWAELRALPTSKVTLDGEFMPGRQEVTVLFLSDLYAALPRAPGVDTLFASCSDGYAAIYRDEFTAQYRPFLVLEIAGLKPEDWKPPAMKFHPGPYVILVDANVVPAVAGLLDAGHKRPWGVDKIEFARFSAREADAYRGSWANLSPAAQAGREIWINSCASCHPGPGAIFGGNKSQRPFPILQVHASAQPEFFRQYVRAPQSLVPTAKMEPHPHYTDAQLEQLRAFITADGRELGPR